MKALRRLCEGSAEALRRLCGCFLSEAECLFRDALPLFDRPGKLFTRYILLTNTVTKNERMLAYVAMTATSKIS